LRTPDNWCKLFLPVGVFIEREMVAGSVRGIEAVLERSRFIPVDAQFIFIRRRQMKAKVKQIFG